MISPKMVKIDVLASQQGVCPMMQHLESDSHKPKTLDTAENWPVEWSLHSSSGTQTEGDDSTYCSSLDGFLRAPGEVAGEHAQ